MNDLDELDFLIREVNAKISKVKKYQKKLKENESERSEYCYSIISKLEPDSLEIFDHNYDEELELHYETNAEYYKTVEAKRNDIKELEVKLIEDNSLINRIYNDIAHVYSIEVNNSYDKTATDFSGLQKYIRNKYFPIDKYNEAVRLLKEVEQTKYDIDQASLDINEEIEKEEQEIKECAKEFTGKLLQTATDICIDEINKLKGSLKYIKTLRSEIVDTILHKYI
jgi:hypothetical protein